MKLWNYRCSTCGVFEAWSDDRDLIHCECGKLARRMIGSKGILLNPLDESFPRAGRMWADHHERMGTPIGGSTMRGDEDG